MDYKETIWVTGCKGFLGREIVKRLKATYNCTVVGTDKELMVADPERIEAFAQDVVALVLVIRLRRRFRRSCRVFPTASMPTKLLTLLALAMLHLLQIMLVPLWYKSQQTTCSPYAWRNPPMNSTRPTPKPLMESRSAQAR